MDNKISIYTILYYDLDFLDYIYENIYDSIDEIIIVDGPYNYCLPFLEKLGLLYNEKNKPSKLNEIVKKYGSKIKYHYKIWENEKEKRIFGYEQCKNDIVLLVDSDEIINLSIENIKKFIDSNESVAGFDLYNMNRININFDEPHICWKMFKKNKITSHQHLSYLWLMGADGLEKAIHSNHYFDNTMGIIYHQTLNRTKFNSIIKYVFYTRLYYLRYDKEKINLIFGNNIDDILKLISVEELLNIFYHSSIELIGIPNNKILNLNNDVRLDLSRYSNNHKEAYFVPSTKFLTNVNFCSYININKKSNKIRIYFDNVKDVNIIFYEICLNQNYIEHHYNFKNIKNDKIDIEIEFKNNIEDCINFVLSINSPHTIDNKNVYTIKNIEFF